MVRVKGRDFHPILFTREAGSCHCKNFSAVSVDFLDLKVNSAGKIEWLRSSFCQGAWNKPLMEQDKVFRLFAVRIEYIVALTDFLYVTAHSEGVNRNVRILFCTMHSKENYKEYYSNISSSRKNLIKISSVSLHLNLDY